MIARGKLRLNVPALAGLILVLVSACAPTVHPHRSAWYWENVEPLVRAESLPGYEFSRARRVTVLRLAGTEFATNLSPIAEQQALLATIYHLESLGFAYVENLDDADLVAAISYADNPYKSTYVPPSSVVVPSYVPGQTFTTTSSSTTNAWAHGSQGWATGFGTTYSTAVTSTPGYWTTQTVTRAGYETGAYYPTVSLTLLDASSGETVFYGSYVAVTQIPDLRVSLPWAMLHITSRLPSVPGSLNCPTPVRYRVGLATLLGTIDGNSYFPVILDLDSAIEVKSGDILVEDIILRVNGKSMQGATYCDFWESAKLNEPSDVRLTLIRGGETVETVIGKRPL